MIIRNDAFRESIGNGLGEMILTQQRNKSTTITSCNNVNNVNSKCKANTTSSESPFHPVNYQSNPFGSSYSELKKETKRGKVKEEYHYITPSEKPPLKVKKRYEFGENDYLSEFKQKLIPKIPFSETRYAKLPLTKARDKSFTTFKIN
ncbi:hypothetical protein ABK040_005960 [Willaertia magna]